MLKEFPRCWIQDRAGDRAISILKGSTEVSKVCRFFMRHEEGLAQARKAQGLDGDASGLSCWDVVGDTDPGGVVKSARGAWDLVLWAMGDI